MNDESDVLPARYRSLLGKLSAGYPLVVDEESDWYNGLEDSPATGTLESLQGDAETPTPWVTPKSPV